jgi:hypothetical protein
MLENILALNPNAQAKVCFGLGLNYHSLESNTSPKYIDFISFQKFYALGYFILVPRTLGLLCLEDICLRMFIGLWAYGLRFFA